MHKFNDDSPGKYNTGRRLDKMLGTLLVFMEKTLHENANIMDCQKGINCTYCKYRKCIAYEQIEEDNNES
jgi:hypothetical protein